VSDYPIGATWEAVDKTGKKGTIWLDERRGKFEIWRWSWTYADGSAPFSASDWAVSYKSARYAIPLKKGARFKRVK
jgi:hypothetical protein